MSIFFNSFSFVLFCLTISSSLHSSLCSDRYRHEPYSSCRFFCIVIDNYIPPCNTKAVSPKKETPLPAKQPFARKKWVIKNQ